MNGRNSNFLENWIDGNITEIDTSLFDGPWPDPVESDPAALAKVRLGKGLIWRCTDDGAPLYQRKLTVPEVRQRIEKQFPKVKGCLGSAKIKNQVNKSLRWAVSNALPVLTPQLFIGDKRVCDEDTDLGLEYTVEQMLQGDDSRSSRRR